MNKIQLKVCGMREQENILQVGELLPDYMGFIFYPKSKRFVGDEFRIPDKLPRSIKRVGVFVNEETNKILALAKTHNLDFIQLHGSEPVSQCAELKSNHLGVIKVVAMDDQFDFLEMAAYKRVVNYVLFDTKSDSYGGTGKTFDWNLLDNYDQDIPFFLSGGLSISHMEQAKHVAKMNLHAFDFNSGVELSPGIKDIDKVIDLKNILNSST
jgi:phosphoribosylanthranilate isomerase